MPSIGDMSYGFDQGGLEEYLEQIRSEVLQIAQQDVMDISSIVNVCETEWEGKARENFVVNLAADAQHVADQYGLLYNALQSEIRSLQAAMANKDETLINL